jgi:hypothetical protein
VKIADLRTDYMRETLDESNVAPDPIRQFEHWFSEAVKAQVPEPNAMTLATVGSGGRPRARIVLLKGFDDAGFVFFTNFASRKGRELELHGAAALLFFWPELERQIRIEGVVTKVDDAESIGTRIGLASQRGHGPPAKRADRGAAGAGGALRSSEGAVSGSAPSGAAASALGRLSTRPGRARVLAGPSLTPA